jgi:hypothetical protein
MRTYDPHDPTLEALHTLPSRVGLKPTFTGDRPTRAKAVLEAPDPLAVQEWELVWKGMREAG